MLSVLLAALVLGAPPSAAEIPAQPPTAVAEPEAEANRDLEFELGGRFVLRPEARANTTFSPAQDDEWRVRQGARLNLGLHYRWFHMVFQPQDVRDWGVETTTLSLYPGVTTHQAHVEMSSDRIGRRGQVKGYLRAGRQEVRMWQDRLLAHSPWQPSSRAFDGIRGRLDIGRVGVEAAAVLLRLPRTLTIADPDDPDAPGVSIRSAGEQLYWAGASFSVHEAFNLHVATWALIQSGTEADPYRLRRILTPGVYLHGQPIRRLGYQVEGYVQRGVDGTVPHRAWAATAAVTYRGIKGPKPGLGLAYEVASGHACPADPSSTTCDVSVVRDFEAHFGARHRYQGFADRLGFRNVQDFVVRGSLKPDPQVAFTVDYHLLSLFHPQGEWRRTNGALVGLGSDPSNTRSLLGHEVDVGVDYRPLEGIRLRPGYAGFVPVAGGRVLGGTQPQHFVYLWLIAELGARWRPEARRRRVD